MTGRGRYRAPGADRRAAPRATGGPRSDGARQPDATGSAANPPRGSPVVAPAVARHPRSRCGPSPPAATRRDRPTSLGKSPDCAGSRRRSASRRRSPRAAAFAAKAVCRAGSDQDSPPAPPWRQPRRGQSFRTPPASRPETARTAAFQPKPNQSCRAPGVSRPRQTPPPAPPDRWTACPPPAPPAATAGQGRVRCAAATRASPVTRRSRYPPRQPPCPRALRQSHTGNCCAAPPAAPPRSACPA